jgi:hypothetical protein
MGSRTGKAFKKFVWFLIGLSLLMIPKIFRNNTPQKSPVPVTVGAYITDIYDVDLKKDHTQPISISGSGGYQLFAMAVFK